jgi:ABC-2 type transport system ATP-binding protein
MSEKLAVKVNSLTVQFGDFKAVSNVSFEVPAGEIFGFLGANGAGKTTTIRVLCGLLLPTSGNVEVAGITYQDKGGEMKIKSKVGYMSQKFTLYNDLTVEENLEFSASLRKIPKPEFEKRKKELFDFISFTRDPNTMVKDLPGGLKQKVSLAACLLHDPEIIFLDEPTAGVTAVSRKLFWDLIKDLAKRGKTIFVTSHYMDEVEQCDRIALMRSGELIALDTPTKLKTTTFPHPLYELIPHSPIPFSEIEKIRADGLFESFEAYGLRYHASAKTPASWQEFIKNYGKDFETKEITPSLEDVFIRLVEGKTR